MDLQNLVNDFIPYGLPSLIVGVAVGAAFAIINVFLKKKNVELDAFYPFLTGVAVFFAYALIGYPVREVFSEEMISANLLCGSLSTAAFVFIKNLKNGGAENKNALKNLLSCYTDEKKAREILTKIKKIAKENEDKTELADKIFSLLLDEGLNSFAAKNVAEKLSGDISDKDKL